jgi:hypothetical protein
MSGFTLGQRVRYAEHIQRRHSRPGEFDGPDKIWSAEPYPGGRTKGGEGIIVGKRTLSNGHTQWMGEYGGTVYSVAESFTAYVIAFDLRRKPVFVLPQHITALEESA